MSNRDANAVDIIYNVFICVACIMCFLIGNATGYKHGKEDTQKEAIKNDVGEYDNQTGQFKWKSYLEESK
jgi:hypothetical protein